MKLIVVISESNDECTINNKAWHDDGRNWQEAMNYADQIEKELGCKMLIRIVEVK